MIPTFLVVQFVYAGLKALNKGILSPRFREPIEKGFQGILWNCVEVDADGRVHLHRINRGAGLGGTPYRDGSFTYYVNEPVVSDDPKSVAPFFAGLRAGLFLSWRSVQNEPLS